MTNRKLLEKILIDKEPIGLTAIKRAEQQVTYRVLDMTALVPKPSEALLASFDWKKSPEGHAYWDDIFNRLRLEKK